MGLNGNSIKIIGVGATVLGLVASLAAGWVNDKKMDQTVSDKVAEAITKLKGNES